MANGRLARGVQRAVNAPRAWAHALTALALCTVAYNAIGHSVGQVQTTKFLAPETVQLLIGRAGSGTPGFQVGDIVSYIIQFTPVANNATYGVAGYVTDYIPPGTEVVGAAIVQPSGGNYVAVAPGLPGSIDNGWSGGQNTYLIAPYNSNAFDATGLCAAPAPVYTNNCNGSVAQVYADTGIFYSTDPRTAQFPAYPARIRQSSNGYNIAPTAAGQLNPIIGQTQATTHNLWDADQTNAFGSLQAAITAAPAPKSPQLQISSSGRRAAPFGAGSAVAGPQSGFPLDSTGSVGPWQRIAYGGSRIGTTSTGPATAIATTKFDTTPDTLAVKGVPTSAGANLSPSTPLPASTNAVRWSVGALAVGQNKYVKISLRLTAPVPATGLINGSEVFGGDAAGADNGNDSAWRYHVPSVADNNSNLFVFKEVVRVNGVASNGATVPPNAKIRYRITYLNSGNAAQTSVVLSDTLPSQTGAGSVSNAAVVSGPNILPFTPASPAAGGTITFQTLASLAAGAVGSVEFDVQTTGANGDTVLNSARLVSNELPAPGVNSNAVSSVQNVANLQITKSATPANIAPGGAVTYTITVTNAGAAAASGIVVRDFLPTAGGALNANTRFNFVTGSSVVSGIAAVTPAAVAPPTVVPYTSENRQQLTWTFGSTLAAGASFTVQFQATAGSAVPASASAYTNDAKVDYNAGEAIVASTAPVFVGSSLSGTVFEDVNYGGGAGSSLVASSGVVRPNVRVELYDASGAFLRSTTSDASGAYAFSGLAAGNYSVRAVNATVQSSRFGGTSCSACVPVQTFRADATSGSALADANRVGGENPTLADAGSGSTTLAALAVGGATAQSLIPVTLGSSSIAGLDFGFNFDTIVSTRDSGQGSLRQFIVNANALSNSGLAQTGQSAGKEVSIFMVSDGAAHPGLRAGLANQLAGGVAVITPLSALPALTDANTTLDGSTQTTNVGDSNAGALGTGGTVGVGNLSLPLVNRPEVQIVDGAASLSIGLDLQASALTVRGIAISGFGNVANNDGNANIRLGASASAALIENNVIGSGAASFADPGLAARSGGDNVRAVGAAGGTLRNNLIGYAAGKGVGLQSGANGWSVSGNEIRGNGIGNANLDGIDVESSSSATISGNLVIGNEGNGIDTSSSAGSNPIQNNTIRGNGIGGGVAAETAGVRLYGSGNNVALNVIEANYGAGVMVVASASANTISRNSIHANGTVPNKLGAGPSGQIGIDLLNALNNAASGSTPFVTLNDLGDADAGGNGLLNYPVLTTVMIQGPNLVVSGFAQPGATIELFIAAPDASGFGEGQTYLATLVEGSAADTDNTTGSYGPLAINGKLQGTDATNRFRFTIPLPGGVGVGTQLTATATLSSATSEFSGTVAVTIAPPVLGKVFAPASTGVGDVSTLTFTLSNPNSAAALSGVAFTDAYPSGLVNAALPNVTNTCGGSVSGGAAAGNTIGIGGVSLAASASCTLTVQVTSAAAGSYANTSGAITSGNGGSGNSASATLTVITKPTIAKAIAANSVALNGSATLTLTLTETSNTALSGVAFNDAFPPGLVVAAAPALTNTCGGTVSGGSAGATSVGLSGGTLTANGSCQINLAVTSASAGLYTNTSGGVASAQSGAAGAASNSAALTVLAPPSVTKAFAQATIARNAGTTLTLTLTNPNASGSYSNLALGDSYPAGLVNAATPNASNTCGGTLTAAASGGSLTLSGGTLAAAASCVLSVDVTSAAAGTYLNSTGNVSAGNGGSGNSASATLTVLAPPAIAKAFAPASIGAGGISTLTFTLTNPNAAHALAGLAFGDTYPAGLVNAATPALVNNCGGSTTGGAAGGNSVDLAGGSLAAGASCTLSVNVTSSVGGAYNNTSGVVSSSNAGAGNTASATLTVQGKPSIAKAFAPASIAAAGSSTLTLTITNNSAAALSGVFFVDTFPAGLTVAAAPALGNTCGGTISGGTAGNSVLDLAGGSLAASASCSISVTVTASTAGTYDNGASGVASNQTGSAGAASNTARLTVLAPPSISKAFSPTVIGSNGISTLSFTLVNNNAVALTGVAFSDVYPANLVNAALPLVSNTCGGSIVGGVSGGGSIALAGGTIAANGSCSVSVNVTSSVRATYNNVSGAVTSSNGGSGNTASATLTVSANPSIGKAFSPTVVRAGGVSTVTFVLSNNALAPANNASFSDPLPAGLVVAPAPAPSNGCGGTLSASAGSTSITLSGGTIAALGNCTVTVPVTAAAAGNYPNTASAVSSSIGSGDPSNTALLTVTAPATIGKSFSPASILANGNSTLGFIITNPNSVALTGLAFSDNFPAGGLQVAAAPNLTNSCGGTVSGATPASVVVALGGGTLAAGASCSITVVVTSPIPGNFSNTTSGVSANETATGSGATATLLTVVSPDLRLTKTHSGSFVVGATGSYTLLVDNAQGTASTSGTITVTDTLPAGLGYVAAGSGGGGWSCGASGQVVSCTSNAVIAAGAASASPLTIIVSVAAVAVPAVTNRAAVSGGGEPAVMISNNEAFDPTNIVAAPQNAFAPDGAQTVLAGSTAFYAHRYNAGSAGSVSFGVSNTAEPAQDGWSSVLYRDANCNGVLDAGEAAAPLSGPTSVSAGDALCIVVKVYAPATAPYGARHVASVSATFTPLSGAPTSATRTDITTVGSAGGAGLALTKTVRNIGTGGSASTSNAARPGDMLEYVISFTNNAAEPLSSIIINDATPAFTTFVSAACVNPLPANLTACAVTAQPAPGAAGAIAWTLSGALASTQNGTVVFRVLLQ